MRTAQTLSEVRRPVAGDVIPRPNSNPPLGTLPGDELLDCTQTERVRRARDVGAAIADVEHDRVMDHLVAVVNPGVAA